MVEGGREREKSDWSACAGPITYTDLRTALAHAQVLRMPMMVGELNVSAFVCVYTDLSITQVARVQSSRLQGFSAVKLPSTKVEPGTIMAHHTNILVATSGIECANAYCKKDVTSIGVIGRENATVISRLLCYYEVGMSALVDLDKLPSLYSRCSVRTRCRISRTVFQSW
jgi:hypothetical protein